METRYVKEVGGRYEANVDITVEEWKSMLQNPEIFRENDVDMVLKRIMKFDIKQHQKLGMRTTHLHIQLR